MSRRRRTRSNSLICLSDNPSLSILSNPSDTVLLWDYTIFGGGDLAMEIHVGNMAIDGD